MPRGLVVSIDATKVQTGLPDVSASVVSADPGRLYRVDPTAEIVPL